MLLAPHFLVGAALARVAPVPAVGLGFALFSHYLLDQLPHWHYVPDANPLKRPLLEANFRQATRVFLPIFFDLLLGAILVLMARPKDPFYLFIGGFLAVLPDGLLFLAWQLPRNRILGFLRDVHMAIHITPVDEPAWPLGIPLQLIIMVVALAVVFSV